MAPERPLPRSLQMLKAAWAKGFIVGEGCLDCGCSCRSREGTFVSGPLNFSVDVANEVTSLSWSSGSTRAISSDNAGNVTVDQVPTGVAGVFEERDYAWDDNSRLTSVTAGGSHETCQYTDDGMRQSQVTGVVTTEFLHDGENLLQES